MNFTDNDESIISRMRKILFDQDLFSTLNLENNDDLKKFIIMVVEDIFGQYSLNEYSRILNIWKRDTRLIRTKVLDDSDTDKKSSLEEKQEENSLVENESYSKILLDYSVWTDLLKNQISIKDRLKLSQNGIEILNSALQTSDDFKCWLREKHNFFKKENSRKRNSPIWNGYFRCIEKLCKNEYQLLIPQKPIENQKFEIKILVNENQSATPHVSKGKPALKLRGEVRHDLALQIMSSGTVNVQSSLDEKNKIEKDGKFKTVSLAVLKQIKSEYRSSFKISNELIIDTLATKNLITKMDVNGESETKLTGYIRNISADPYGFLIFSQLNVNLWKNHCNKYPDFLVCYFDATGSIIENIKGQNKTFYYSIVANDKEKSLTYPLAEFVTTDNTSLNISNYLSLVKNYLVNNIKNVRFPTVIVTDFCWALLNAINYCFNYSDLSLNSYIKFCFLEAFGDINQETKRPNVRLYLCSTHFLKNIVLKAKKVTKDYTIVKTFVYSFSLLQNSTKMSQIDQIYTDMLIIFRSRYKNKRFLESYMSLSEKLLTRDLEVEYENVISSTDYAEKIDPDSTKNLNCLKKDSEFGKYFSNIKNKIESEIDAEDELLKKEESEENIFFSSELIEIVDNYMYLVPLWTGLCLTSLKLPKLFKESESETTRLSNNYVESWFKFLKHDLLNSLKLVKPSVFIGLHAPRIKFISNQVVNIKNISSELLFEETGLDCQTAWKDKKMARRTYHDSTNIKKIKNKKTSKNSKIKARTKKMKSRIFFDTETDENDDSNVDHDSDSLIGESEQESLKDSTSCSKKKQSLKHSLSTNSITTKKTKKAKRVYQPRLTPRIIDQFMPKWGGSFYDQELKINIKFTNTCTIDNILFGFWVSVKSSRRAFLETLVTFSEQIEGYRAIQAVIEEIDRKEWGKAKYTWLKTISKLNFKNGTVDCLGTEYEYFIEYLKPLQTFKSVYNCLKCSTTKSSNVSDLLFYKQGKTLMTNLNEDFTVSCKKCKATLTLINHFEKMPLWLVFEANFDLNIFDLPEILSINDQKYRLLLVTVNKNEHFYSIIKSNERFYEIDGLNSVSKTEIKDHSANTIVYVLIIDS